MKQNPKTLLPSDLEDVLGYNLKRASVVMQNVFRDAQGEEGLAPRVFAALALVVEFPHVTQSVLAVKLGIKRSGLVAIVDELEDRAFLARTTVPGDRRVQALVPTEAGIAAFNNAAAKVRAKEAETLADFSESEVLTLLELLRKIRGHEGDE